MAAQLPARLDRPVFVVGPPRSGTTLMRHTLNRHPDLEVTAETHLLDVWCQRFPELVEGRGVDAFWREFGRSDDVARSGLDAGEVWARLSRLDRVDARAVLATMLSMRAEGAGAARAGEKTPRHALHVGTLLRWFPDARVVWMRRDPRAVVASELAFDQAWASDDPLLPARRWVRVERALARHHGDDRVHVVRYEDLVRTPEPVLREVLAHLDLSVVDEVVVGPSPRTGTWHGGQDPAARPTPASLDRWRDRLTPHEQGVVDGIVGGWRSRAGYPSAGRHLAGADRRAHAGGVVVGRGQVAAAPLRTTTARARRWSTATARPGATAASSSAPAGAVASPTSGGPILVVGPPRSGTTLLRVMLCRHPDVWILTETHLLDIWTRRFPGLRRGERAAFDAYWEAFTATEPFTWLAVDADRVADRVHAAGAYRHTDVLRALFDEVRSARGVTRAGEKTPDHALHLGSLLEGIPDARVLWTMRDPRTTVASELALDRPWASDDAGVAALRWARSARALLAWQDDPRVLRVPFEDLVARPEEVLHEVCRHVGVAHEPAMLHDEGGHDAYRHGRRDPWGRLDAGAGRDDRLTPRQLEQVDHVAGGLAVDLGYPRPRVAAVGSGRPTVAALRLLRHASSTVRRSPGGPT